LKLGIALGVANLAVAIASFGTSAGAEEAASQAATKLIAKESDSLAQRLLIKVVGNKIGGATTRASKLLYGTGKDVVQSAAKIAAATVLAKVIVHARANQVNSGFAQGTDLATNADAGGNLHANELERSQNFGRPLTPEEVSESDVHDTKFIAMQNSSKSFTDRYFATSNAQSLVSRLAMDMSGVTRTKITTSIVKLGSTILKPMAYIGSLLDSLGGVSHAAPAPGTQHYGNIQFGWSEAEEKLVDSNSSYQSLANQAILDASGNEAAIAKKFAACFGYSSDDAGTLTLASGIGQPGSLGTLLSKGDIIRSAPYGDVVDADKALCSPSHLSYQSTDSLALDNMGSPQKNDMIFRWRLAHFYATTLEQLTSTQSVTN